MSSLQQIADRLSISVSLVSKVLNDRLGTTGVREELRERIRATAREMGYQKNFNASALRAGCQGAIAVALHYHGSAGSGITEEFVRGVSAAARGFRLRQDTLFYESMEEFHELSGWLHRGSVDGVIVGGWRHPELVEDLLALRKRGLPVITVFNDPISDQIPNVGMPDAELILCTMRHLLSIGRRQILHVSSRKERMDGYRLALQEAGLEYNPDMVFHLRGPEAFTPKNGREAVRRLIDKGLRFDAVCAQGDAQAIGAMQELVRVGLRIPQDVAVTGVDDAPFSTFGPVALTTVSQRVRERAVIALEMLREAIAGGTPVTRNLEPLLIVRESTTVG